MKVYGGDGVDLILLVFFVLLVLHSLLLTTVHNIILSYTLTTSSNYSIILASMVGTLVAFSKFSMMIWGR
jgi:hypothetical protein